MRCVRNNKNGSIQVKPKNYTAFPATTSLRKNITAKALKHMNDERSEKRYFAKKSTVIGGKRLE